MSVSDQGYCGTASRREWRRSRPGAWRPLEVAAMVAGFAVFWPVGLAVLLAKVGQRRENYPGDLFAYARDKVSRTVPSGGQWAMPDWTASRGQWTSRWNQGFGVRSTGNSAFDAWRAGELDRLEAERRKLADAEREFAEHLDRLRQARDREEFDRFMNERNAARANQTGPSPSA